MPNDTPDYQPGANYVAVPQPAIGISNVAPGPYNIAAAAYTSVLLRLAPGGSGLTVTATWLDASGNTVGQFTLAYGPGVFYLKLPVAGPTLRLQWAGGAGQVTVFGGAEPLTAAAIASDGTAVQDGIMLPYLTVAQATVAGNGIALGTSYVSGRVWLDWVFTSTVTGYLSWTALTETGTSPNIYVAASSEAVTLPSTTTAKWQGFVNLPAQPVAWTWTPQVTAASAACNLALVKG